MTTSIATLSDDKLWELAHATAQTKTAEIDVSVLPEALATALTVELVQGIVDNGGVEYLLGPDLPRGLQYSDCIRSFKLIESWLCAEALSEVCKAFPSGSPSEQSDSRQAALERLLESQRQLVNHASRVFWDASASNYAAALRLLRGRPEVLNAAA